MSESEMGDTVADLPRTDSASRESSYLKWLDIAKGIGILLVIYGHIGEPLGRDFIYSFHMPLFFLLAGYSFSIGNDFPSFLKKRVCRLLVPFFLYFILNFLFYSSWRIVFLKKAPEWQRALEILPLWGTGNSGGLWFLIALFFALIALRGIWRICSNPWALTAWACVALGVGFYLSSHVIVLPLFLGSSITALFFMLLGRGIRASGVVNQNWVSVAFCCAVAIGVTLWANTYMPQVDMRRNMYNPFWVFVVAALSGSLACVFFSRALERVPGVSNVLAFCGRYSLPLLALHFMMFEFARPGTRILLRGAGGIWHDILMTVLSALFCIFATIVAIRIMERLRLKRFTWIWGVSQPPLPRNEAKQGDKL